MTSRQGADVEKPTCFVEGCARQGRIVRGWCPGHYENWRRTGKPKALSEMTLVERLDHVGVRINRDTECWEWAGHRNALGYGLLTSTSLGLSHARVHRLVYELWHDVSLDEKEIIRHRCDNPPCVNPDHLRKGTQADNVQDMVERGRHWRHGRSECKRGHDLTLPGATFGTGTECSACRRMRSREWARRQRALLGA
jgi:hypothetical protein